MGKTTCAGTTAGLAGSTYCTTSSIYIYDYSVSTTDVITFHNETEKHSVYLRFVLVAARGVCI